MKDHSHIAEVDALMDVFAHDLDFTDWTSYTFACETQLGRQKIRERILKLAHDI